ncbi:LOW QUALITY PROTEIN: hypothetical protein HID58_015385 [Brassica napus]|uniref:Uncharacterized protein n=1 Tax=Brassica napus TaxID=3708 RepID=A0ABQ8DK96_BRANA|nr:LOW QUALITY PROTEIN: hypothetical protein HID58_015385 [Brassica napus]
MDTPLAMGAFVSARFLKFLLSTTVRNRKSFVVQSKRLDFGFPCSKGGPQTIQNLTKQFHPSLTEEEKIKKKEGKCLKFFFLEKRFNTQPIKTRETTWSFNGSHELECSHLYVISGTGSEELNQKIWVWLEEHTVPGIKAVLRVGGDVVNGRRSAMVILAATLFSSTYGSASANAGVIDDFYERSKPTKELNDKKTLATSGANFVRDPL